MRRTTIAVGLLAALLGSVSCGDRTTGKSPSLLVISQLGAASGANPGQFSGNLASDVVTLVNQSINGQSVRVPTIYEDPAQVGLLFVLKDRGNPGADASPTALNSIQINRYRVTYRRADGRNVPGVDVPYGFDGALTVQVTDAPVLATFILVRVQAKEEAPLKSLSGGGGRIAIATIADVTFFGHDLGGNSVQATGSISVNFADWGDPD